MKKLTFVFILSLFFVQAYASGLETIVNESALANSFPIVSSSKNSTILYDEKDFDGVKRAIKDLQNDIKLVTDISPELNKNNAQTVIIIGTIGKSALIDELIQNKKINVNGVSGNWESTLIEVVSNPKKGIEQALVIAGSDKRGTIYGVYELSYQMGVSPWYYWADVPVKKSKSLFVKAGRYIIESPAVKYRGIFLNDEAPALTGWAKKEFGGFNHQFYEKVFELILRLKGNYLWPAMWGSAFNDDDKLNPVKADEYGIVIGTSHHEPLTRAHDEWRRYGKGFWDYTKNEEELKKFWKTGFERVADKEILVTLGMRGDGDEPMTEGTATALLEKIVKDQRDIIKDVTQKPAEQTPQVWALYKEVQDYYDKGMRVPDDVTLLLCDDNWGNIRKLPDLKEAPRKGGYGIYYHFDYVGGPRNYKWINTNPIQKTWEQMNLAYQYDANQIWIVNVGDLKPMEFPIEFFLDYAWNPDAIPSEQLKNYTINWTAKQFGDPYKNEIADLIDTYLKYAGRIKPELLNAQTYSLTNYREWERVIADYDSLLKKALEIKSKIPQEYQDSYYQLVLHPIEANGNLHHLYYAHAQNTLYAKQGRNVTNHYADEVEKRFKRDAEITHYYNDVMANGKWKHMMDQTHIGYTYWQQPESNVMPKTTQYEASNKPSLGLSIEASESFWTGKATANEKLPVFNAMSKAKHYFELFNRGNGEVKFNIKASKYITLSQTNGSFKDQERIWVTINWDLVPKGLISSQIIVSGNEGSRITLPITIDNRFSEGKNLFVEQNGIISIEAPHYSRANNNRPVFWKHLENHGKTLGGMTVYPSTVADQKLDHKTPYLEYDIFVNEAGNYTLHTLVSPTLDFRQGKGLQFAISINDEQPVIVNITEDDNKPKVWDKAVANSIKEFKTELNIAKAGKNTIKYWMISPAVVLQKLILDTGGLKYSFLGPEETLKP